MSFWTFQKYRLLVLWGALLTTIGGWFLRRGTSCLQKVRALECAGAGAEGDHASK
jgi:hypothetical protein